MLGGGVFVTQNKVLPGSYINFVNATKATSSIGERGTVALALALNNEETAGKVIELTKLDLASDCKNITGYDYTAKEVAPLREIFCNANKVYVYDLGTNKTVADAVSALEAYDFNVLCAYTADEDEIAQYISSVKTWRDEMGKKCQLVVYNTSKVDHEGVINVVSGISDDDAPSYALVAWVAGAEAGCNINESCTNKLYDGEYSIVANKTQSQLEDCITNGEIAFHLVYGEIRLLEDVNTLTTTDANKGEDFKSNQTIRIIDQIANDIAKLFNTKYLGRIPNNQSGRMSLWGDIVAHHKELERIQAIENFDAELLTVEQGANKKSVVVNDAVTPLNAMAQLYMTVVVQ